MAVSDNTKLFGVTPMGEQVAELGDLAKVLKSAAAIPTGEDAVEGTVVYLTANDGKYLEGHYYQYKMVGGELVWKDVGAPGDDITVHDGYCNIFYDSGHIFICLKDCIPYAYPWTRSEVILVDRYKGNDSGETIILSSDQLNQYDGTSETHGACRIRTDLTLDELMTTKRIIHRTWSNKFKKDIFINKVDVTSLSALRKVSELPAWLRDEDTGEPLVDLPNLTD